MSKSKRTIYAYESRIFSANSAGDQAQIGWEPKMIEEALSFIIGLPEKERVLTKNDEWFFHLSNVNIDKRDKDPSFEDCIYGWFECVRIGFITDLRQLSTMKTRLNPKRKDESEIRRTYFYFRLRDGLLLLDNYRDNVITPRRLEEYLLNIAETVINKYGVRHITFVPIVSTGFLEELGKFDLIRLARIRLKIKPNVEYNTEDGIGAIQKQSAATYANYLDLVLGRKNARKHGLVIEAVKVFLRKILQQQDQVLLGTIEGDRSDGGPKVLKLSGVEEKHKQDFSVDEKGEVLTEQMFGYIIELGNAHN